MSINVKKKIAKILNVKNTALIKSLKKTKIAPVVVMAQTLVAAETKMAQIIQEIKNN